MCIKKLIVIMLTAMSVAVLLNGCGASSKESAGSASNVPKVSEASCAQCHGSGRSSVTVGYIYDEYGTSKHFSLAGAGCQDCHGGGSQHNGVGPLPFPNPDAAGICVNCHTTTLLGAPHFNNITTLTVGSNVSYPASYVNARNINNCRNCHNPHSTPLSYGTQKTLYADYAESAHGDVNGEGWVHYKWKGADRASCRRCHTTTGLIANLNGTTASFGAGNSEVLDCTGCHSNYNFSATNLRNVAAITNPGFTNVTTIHFSDAGKSNICLKCHVGREAGMSITKSTAFKNFTGTTSFINSHYLTAGGVVFAKTGYEFAGLSYANVGFFQHASVGGTDGACVGCHMKNTNSHKFMPVTKTGDTITAIVSTTCATCHAGGFALTPASLEAEKEELKAATDALKAALALKSIHFANSNPYFFKTATSTARANAVTKWSKFAPASILTGRNTMGAAYNLNMVLHDPGAYAHNRFYIKRLLYDSIDWINDGLINKDVTATINALTALSAQQKAAAIGYLVSGAAGVETLGLR